MFSNHITMLHFYFQVIIIKLSELLCNYKHVYLRKRFASKDFLKKKSKTIPLTDPQKKEIIEFWKPFYRSIKHELHWFEFYNSFCDNKENLKYYIPDSIYYSIIDLYYTNPVRAKQIDDKNLYDLIFNGVRMPYTIVRKSNGMLLNNQYQAITTEEALKLCKSYRSVISKEAVESEGGKGIRFFDFDSTTDQEFIDWLDSSTEITIQEVIQQHSSLAKIHENSINTIRIITLMTDGSLHVLSSVLRMGVGKARVDNASSGGIVCGIDKNGCLKEYAYNIKGERWSQHPQGAIFKGMPIVGYQLCVDQVKSLAGRINGLSRLISWDFAISPEGEPILIEVNLSFGQVDFHQICNGPILQELTDEQKKKVIRESLESTHKLRKTIQRCIRRWRQRNQN